MADADSKTAPCTTYTKEKAVVWSSGNIMERPELYLKWSPDFENLCTFSWFDWIDLTTFSPIRESLGRFLDFHLDIPSNITSFLNRLNGTGSSLCPWSIESSHLRQLSSFFTYWVLVLNSRWNNKQREALKDTHGGEPISTLPERQHGEDTSSCPVQLWTTAKDWLCQKVPGK